MVKIIEIRHYMDIVVGKGENGNGINDNFSKPSKQHMSREKWKEKRILKEGSKSWITEINSTM